MIMIISIDFLFNLFRQNLFSSQSEYDAKTLTIRYYLLHTEYFFY